MKIPLVLSSPVRDVLSAMDRCLQGSPALNTGIIFFCLLMSWWVYVPIHELLHAFGCMIGGGRVTRLELSPVYGAEFLREFFPFISSGSEYAGQLKGFDTFGSDSTYLITVFLPYVLTIVFGVPLLKSAASKTASPRLNSVKLGFAIPLAYAPFIALTGDYYEMASIIISNLAARMSPGFNYLIWRSDDLLKLSGQLFFSGNEVYVRDVIGLATSFLLAIVLILITYQAGAFWSRLYPGRFINKTS